MLLGGMAGERWNIRPRTLAGLRIGIMRHPGAERFLEPEVVVLFEQAVRILADAGAGIRPVELEGLELASGGVVKMIEPEASLIHRGLLRAEPQGFSAVTRSQIEAGFSVSAVEYLEAVQIQARLRSGLRHLFENLDTIISPSVPWVAPAEDPPIGGESGEGEMLYSGVYNLVGLPALSIPCGLSETGLPAGLQIVTPWNKDELALSIGAALERHLPRLQSPMSGA
jgi:Asp-tRNA(Asn)/Glu-tRNA(Gln) amidotransferase A subunit family amidase